jgi:predicted MPP superfamily phosphohydrolase
MPAQASQAGSIAVFFVVVLSIWGSLHAILLWHLHTIPFVAALRPRWALYVIVGLLGLSYIASRLVAGTPLKFLAAPLEIIGATWMGVILLALTCLLVAELSTGFGLWGPRIGPTFRVWALAAAAVLSVTALVQGLRPPIVQRFEVKLAGLPAERDGTVLVFISDLHLGTMTGESWLRARISQIDALHPDIVVVGGDVFEGDGERARALLPTLQRLKAPLGVFAVTGNHDDYGRGPDGRSPLDDAGIRVLRDEWIQIVPGLVIAGVNDGGFRASQEPPADRITRALGGRPPGAATVFISHMPVGAGIAARLGAGLMLSGHTHGGQVWPFGLIVRRFTPLFVGRYDVAGMPVIVCRGTGTFGPRMRLWRRGEILHLTLRTAPGRS